MRIRLISTSMALAVALLAGCGSESNAEQPKTGVAAKVAALTANAASKPAVPAPSSQSPSVAYDVIAKNTTGFTVGDPDAAREAFVFFDPQCPHCAALWRASQPLLASKQLRMTWIPVGILSRASSPQGATIVTADDPAKAMAEHEQLLGSGRSGISANSVAADGLADAIKYNTSLLQSMLKPNDGVPYTVAKVNGKVTYVSGAMPTADLFRFLDLGSVPPKP